MQSSYYLVFTGDLLFEPLLCIMLGPLLVDEAKLLGHQDRVIDR